MLNNEHTAESGLSLFRLVERASHSGSTANNIILGLYLLSESDAAVQSTILTQWTLVLLFEVESRRFTLLRMKAVRSEIHKLKLQPEMDLLLADRIALEPASNRVFWE